MSDQEKKVLILKIIKRFSLVPVVLGLLTLAPAGTFDFWQVYVYIGILVIPMTFVLFYFLKNDPMFLERRTRAAEKEKEQKIIQIVFSFFYLLGFILPGFDSKHSASYILP